MSDTVSRQDLIEQMRRELKSNAEYLEKLAYLESEFYDLLVEYDITTIEEYEIQRLEFEEDSEGGDHSSDYVRLMDAYDEGAILDLFIEYGELSPLGYLVTTCKEGLIVSDSGDRVVFEYTNTPVSYSGRLDYNLTDVIGARIPMDLTVLGGVDGAYYDTDRGILWAEQIHNGQPIYCTVKVSAALKRKLNEIHTEDYNKDLLKNVLRQYYH